MPSINPINEEILLRLVNDTELFLGDGVDRVSKIHPALSHVAMDWSDPKLTIDTTSSALKPMAHTNLRTELRADFGYPSYQSRKGVSAYFFDTNIGPVIGVDHTHWRTLGLEGTHRLFADPTVEGLALDGQPILFRGHEITDGRGGRLDPTGIINQIGITMSYAEHIACNYATMRDAWRITLRDMSKGKFPDTVKSFKRSNRNHG
jgi:hypothetical protein